MTLRAFTLIPALLYGSLLFSQKIDSIRTDGEVLSFVRSLDKNYKNLYIVSPRSVLGLEDYEASYREFGSKAYEKADFDGNRLTDLLFRLIGTYGLAALQRTLIGMRDLKHWKRIKGFDERTFVFDY